MFLVYKLQWYDKSLRAVKHRWIINCVGDISEWYDNIDNINTWFAGVHTIDEYR